MTSMLRSEIGPPQERGIRRLRATEHQMVAAAGADMAAVDHVFVGAEPALPRILVDTGL